MLRSAVTRAKEWVATTFNGNYRAAFDHFDTDRDGKLTGNDVAVMLAAIRVGNLITRHGLAQMVISRLDTDGDGYLSWAEFEAALTQQGN